MAPRAVSSTAQIATRPSQRTLAPTSASSCPAPAATSQPEDLADRGAERRGLLAVGQRDAGVRRPTGTRGPRRRRACSRTSSAGAGSQRGPPAQATTRPGSHESWSWTISGSRESGSGPRSLRPCAGGLGAGASTSIPVRRDQARTSRWWSASASASTWVRSGPWSRRAALRCWSAARIRALRVVCQRGRSASSERELLGRRRAGGLVLDRELELPRRDRARTVSSSVHRSSE